MISRFKFLSNNDDDELEFGGFVNDFDYGLASWMWANPEIIQGDPHWEPDEMIVTGIRTFLLNFPEQMIVPIISITGDNITMTIQNEHDGWPFNILGGTPLHIVYLRWIPE
jgi:hypothetical protein